MKTTRSFLLVAALSPAAFLLSSCAKTDADESVAQNAKPATKAIAAEVAPIVADLKSAVADSWDGIKDYSYEKREAFASALDRMAGKLDAEVRDISAKVAGQTETEATKQRSAALKEFNDANISLRSQLMSVRSGTADTWDSAKAKVVESWQAEQAAYDKVKASPLS